MFLQIVIFVLALLPFLWLFRNRYGWALDPPHDAPIASTLPCFHLATQDHLSCHLMGMRQSGHRRDSAPLVMDLDTGTPCALPHGKIKMGHATFTALYTV